MKRPTTFIWAISGNEKAFIDLTVEEKGHVDEENGKVGQEEDVVGPLPGFGGEDLVEVDVRVRGQEISQVAAMTTACQSIDADEVDGQKDDQVVKIRIVV